MVKKRSNENELLDQLPQEIKEYCLKVWKESLDGKNYVIQYKYNLGLLIQKAKEYEKEHPEERGVVDKIQRILHISTRRLLDRTERLVTLFTRQEIDELTQESSSGYRLCFTHFEYVMVGYLSKKQMVAYLKYARQRGIAPQELYIIIKKDHHRMLAGNHKKRVPSSPKEFTKEIMKYLERCSCVDDALSQIPAEEIREWKSKINPTVVQSVLNSLDSHVKKCQYLRKKLC